MITTYTFSKVSDLDAKNGISDDVIGRSLKTKHQMAIIDCEDANKNTPLSEAASKSFSVTHIFFV